MNELFETRYELALIELQQIEQQKKALADREAEIREIICRGMEEYGIDNVDTDYVRIAYIPPTEGKPVLDDKTWRAEDPEGYNKIFRKWNKMSGKRKGYVRITAK